MTEIETLTKEIAVLRERLRITELSGNYDNTRLIRKIAYLQNRRFKILRAE